MRCAILGLSLSTRSMGFCLFTSDPDLHIDIDGLRVRPDSSVDGFYRFAVGPRAARVQFVSRTLVPALDGLPGGDLRRLGVPLLRLALRSISLDIHLPHADPSFAEGFHAAEASHRWTDGGGVVPAQWLRALRDGFAIELRLCPIELRYRLTE